MMNSIFYGLALIAILMIIRWYVVNDGNGQSDGSTGLLAMKAGKPSDPARAPLTSAKKRFRRPQ